MKKHLLLYVVVLIAILVRSHYVPDFTHEQYFLFDFLIIIVGVFVLSIIIRISVTNKIHISKKYLYLSGIPALLLATHISIYIFGDFYAEVGFYWILYVLIVLGGPFSMFFLFMWRYSKSKNI
jgi:hypothetical protein